jgi:DNA-binding transcriptional regulator YdaS (Cro superfamily)
MTSITPQYKAVLRLIEIAGSQTELARRLKCKPRAISWWVTRNKRVPCEMVYKASQAVKGALKPEEIRPDMFNL